MNIFHILGMCILVRMGDIEGKYWARYWGNVILVPILVWCLNLDWFQKKSVQFELGILEAFCFVFMPFLLIRNGDVFKFLF